LSKAAVINALREAGFSGGNLDNMLCIVNCETNFNAHAVNYNAWDRTWDVGVSQINDGKLLVDLSLIT
jgi:hypothetical protein